MSLPPDSSAAEARQGNLLTVLLTLAAFAIFIVIVIISRLPSTPVEPAVPANLDPSEQWKLTRDGRKQHLAEMHGKEKSEGTTYGWVDQQAGVVRLPIERAMELEVTDLQAKQAH